MMQYLGAWIPRSFYYPWKETTILLRVFKSGSLLDKPTEERQRFMMSVQIRQKSHESQRFTKVEEDNPCMNAHTNPKLHV